MSGDRQRQVLADLDIPLWLPRQPLAGGPHPSESLNIPDVLHHASLSGEPAPASLSASSMQPEVSNHPGASPQSEPLNHPGALPQPEPLNHPGASPQPEPLNHPGASRHPSLSKEGNIAAHSDIDFAPVAPNRRAATIAQMDWDTLAAEVRQCTACGLCQTRIQTVFGVGDRRAEWLVIGEAPGADEDRQGEPFVGRAGKLLNPMLQAVGLKREQVYIANILKCLRYNALVKLEDGSWERIGRLVRAHYEGKVMSVDHRGQLVPRRVIGWHESPLGGRRLFRMSYQTAKNAGASRVGIQLTGDHAVLTTRGYIPVEQLKADDRIATGQGLSRLAFDVVCGTLLGDGTLNAKSAYLGFGHSARQRDYALFKAGLLAELHPQVRMLSVAATAGGPKIYPTVHVRTLASRALRTLRAEFYTPRKQVPVWMADRLNERMLAFWFMDDGYTRIREQRKPQAEIATSGFSDHDVQILLSGLSRLGLDAKARRGCLHFDAKATITVCERIAAYIPPSMRYKLPAEIAAGIPFDANRFDPGPAECFFDAVEVEEITDRPRTDQTFFCIDVEDHHNFVTAGGVVHNCRPPDNRDPASAEAASCRPFLERQIALIRPRLILAVGRIAAHNLLATDTPIGKLRGLVHRFGPARIPLVVVYHPAYLLRSPREKRKAWDDLRLARRALTTHPPASGWRSPAP